MNMTTRSLLACVAFTAGCGTTPPSELREARDHYQRASAGPAAELSPAELHVAADALAAAERAYEEHGREYQTRDLAYVASRKAQLAEATAAIAIERQNQSAAKTDFQATQGAIVEKTKEDLNRTKDALQASEQGAAVTEEKLAAEQAQRKAAEQRTADALAALAKLAMVKEEARGLVITLSGSVLFASSKAALLPEARARLDQVSDVLLTTRERRLDVEGHTDSQGADAYNLDLSQRRADAVRDYLVQRGYQADLVQAHGRGEAQPIADNGSPEGRANNRRVEIVVEREAHTANP